LDHLSPGGLDVQTTSWGLVLALWGAGLGAAAQYAKVSVIFDQLPNAYSEATTSLGFMVSLVGTVGIVLGVAAGLYVARAGYRRTLLWALWIGAACSVLQSALPPMALMLLLRVVEGVSHLAIVVTAPTLIAQISAPRHRGLTLTLWSTFFGVAFTLLVLLGLPLVSARGIGALFLAHGIYMACFALILSMFLRAVDAPKPAGQVTLASIWADHVAIYRSPRRAAPGLGWLFYTFCYLALLTLLPQFVEDSWRAFVLGSMPLISIVTSMTVGVLALRYMSAIALVQWGFALTICGLGWLWASPGAPYACIAVACALGLIQGASFAAVPQLNHSAADQAQANGAMAQMGNIGNTLGTPVLLLVLSVAGYGAMIAVAILVLAAGVAVHAVLSGRRARDRS
jgi:predicted MFS family arabinose efflux permease